VGLIVVIAASRSGVDYKAEDDSAAT
jgi:hypothetical protein